eukprot:scaffold98745_cov80-Phaeocystis_antarctica.AAC.1
MRVKATLGEDAGRELGVETSVALALALVEERGEHFLRRVVAAIRRAGAQHERKLSMGVSRLRC